jgi:O-antigen/teichoic acid export membrane protein
VIEGLMMGRVLPANVPGALISAIAAGVAALLAILTFLFALGAVAWGAFVGLLAALALGYGAYLRWTESKTTAPPSGMPPPSAPPTAPPTAP